MGAPRPCRLAALVPVGPAAAEPERLADLVASIAAWEPGLDHLVLVDDAAGRRDLRGACAAPASWRVDVLANPRAGKGVPTLGGLCCATLAGLAHLHAAGPPDIVLRLDTDALVIAPFAECLARAFAGDPGLGIVGAYDRSCHGEPRRFAVWEPVVRRLGAPVSVWRHPARRGRHLQVALTGRRAAVRAEVLAARRHGYVWGEHCLGGGSAIAGALVDRLARRGSLSDPLRWRDTRAGEDVMLGVLARAAGMRLAGMVAPGEPFGVAHAGLPGTPAELIAAGYAIVHSVRRAPGLDEREVRRAFARERRRPPSRAGQAGAAGA